jgi:hypothetical protein
MAEPQFSTHPDDDLPRTIRRERDARQRSGAAAAPAAQAYGAAAASGHAADHAPGEGPVVTVTAVDIPFFRLMAFFIKAVFAAIPALILLGLILFAIGQVAKIFLPWLVKMQIMVTFP